jgi:hypothetical protein
MSDGRVYLVANMAGGIEIELQQSSMIIHGSSRHPLIRKTNIDAS